MTSELAAAAVKPTNNAFSTASDARVTGVSLVRMNECYSVDREEL